MVCQSKTADDRSWPPHRCGKVAMEELGMASCSPGEDGFANVDIDAVSTANIGVQLKDVSYSATNQRYETCGALGSVEVSVTRPKHLTRFDAEWVALYPKGSWAAVAQQREPFAYNDYGAKVPRKDLREVHVDARGVVLDGSTLIHTPAMTTFLKAPASR